MSNLKNSWDSILKPVFDSEYMGKLREFLRQQYRNYTVYPPMKKMLSAFEYTPFEDVKAVILGQDPYHGEGQANGLSFSVNEGIKCPPSLINIYKALEYDLGIPMTDNGDLSGWAKQGVLMLNSVLTVRAGQPQSHAGEGWENFTDEIITLLDKREKPLVFMLWGSYAKAKGKLIKNKNHLVLTSVHPSPLSFYQGFLQCRHFSKVNEFLTSHGIKGIDWAVRSAKEYELMQAQNNK